MSNAYAGLLSEILSRPWAMESNRLTGLVAQLKSAADGSTAARAAIEHIRGEYEVQAARYRSVAASAGAAVAVIPVYGCISHRPSLFSYYFGGASTGSIAQQLRAAMGDSTVKAIVFDVDSPGGSTDGVDELSAEIYNARGKGKKIAAVSNCLNASAAYYLSSAADKVYVSPSSITGSIGVYCAHEDDSEYLAKLGIKITLVTYGKNKAAGDSSQPMSDAYREQLQEMVSTFGGMFDGAVARNRGVSTKAVSERFGQGSCFTAKSAVAAGLADKVATLEEVLGTFGITANAVQTSVSVAVGDIPTPEAAVEAAKTEESGKKCGCACEPCVDGDCSGCTVDPCDDENCPCGNDADTDARAQATKKAQIDREHMEMNLAL